VKTPGNAPVAGSDAALTQESDGKQVTAKLFGYEAPAEFAKDKAIVGFAAATSSIRRCRC